MTEYIVKCKECVRISGATMQFPEYIDMNQEIIRCRDCKHGYEVEGGMYDCLGKLTTKWDYYNDEPQQNLVEPDGFCAWAERNEVKE